MCEYFEFEMTPHPIIDNEDAATESFFIFPNSPIQFVFLNEGVIIDRFDDDGNIYFSVVTLLN